MCVILPLKRTNVIKFNIATCFDLLYILQDWTHIIFKRFYAHATQGSSSWAYWRRSFSYNCSHLMHRVYNSPSIVPTQRQQKSHHTIQDPFQYYPRIYTKSNKNNPHERWGRHHSILLSAWWRTHLQSPPGMPTSPKRRYHVVTTSNIRANRTPTRLVRDTEKYAAGVN